MKWMTQLPHRGVVEIQGEDKATFLQGLITNDINEVTPERAIYAALLTPQGRFLYDFFISEKEGSYFLEAEADRIESLLKRLNLYKLRSQVSLQERPDLKVFALWGEGVPATLDLKEERGCAHGLLFMDPRLLDLGARAIGKKEFAGFNLVSFEEYNLHRLKLGVPEGGQDLIPEKSIPMESGLDELQAISWTKGCYMGQELTKYRGLVRKRLFPVLIEGDSPSQGAEIFVEGTSVGEMRSHMGSYGLAILRLEAFQKGGDFVSGSTRIKPYRPLWMNLEMPS
jgi:tRNA-modifying protein YgfZ